MPLKTLFRGGSMTPRALFRLGELGAWYDPSDTSTLYQSIGTSIANSIPVTATGQPVGLVLDKHTGGRGSELLLNGDFSNGSTSWTVISATLTAVNGVGRHASTAVNGASQQTVTLDTTKLYEITFDVPENTDSITTTVSIREAATTTQSVAITVTAGQTGKFQGIFRPTANSSRIHIRSANVSTGYVGFDNVSIREIPGNHLEQLTATKRPTYRDVGGLQYLEFDGVDDGLTTTTMNFSGLNELLIVAGARKTGTTVDIIAEYSPDSNVNAGFYVAHNVDSPGTIDAVNATGSTPRPLLFGSATPPVSAVLSSQARMAVDEMFAYRNGVLVSSNPGDFGAGNFGAYTLFVGSRNNTTHWLAGNLYGLLIRAKAGTDQERRVVEKYIGQRTGVGV